MRKLLLSLLVPATLLTSAPAFASSSWKPCGFRAEHETITTHMLCRHIAIAHNVFRLEWADGKSDIFLILDNGYIQDSRGGLWRADVHFEDTGIYWSAYSLSSGTKIAWLTSYRSSTN